MRIKRTAIHTVGTYTTDCNCKNRFFRTVKEANIHKCACPDAMGIYYNPPYSESKRLKFYDKK